MISEQEIKELWKCKLTNYLQNYPRRNKLTITQARDKLFSETHDIFFESIPFALNKLLDEKNHR